MADGLRRQLAKPMRSPRVGSNSTGVVCNAQIQAGRNWSLRFTPLPCDTLAEWLRRRPAKPMRSPRVGSNPTGVVCIEKIHQRRERHRVDLKPTRTMANATKGKDRHRVLACVLLACKPKADAFFRNNTPGEAMPCVCGHKTTKRPSSSRCGWRLHGQVCLHCLANLY